MEATTTPCPECGTALTLTTLRSGRIATESCDCGDDALHSVGHFAVMGGQLRGPFPHPPTAADLRRAVLTDTPGH